MYICEVIISCVMCSGQCLETWRPVFTLHPMDRDMLDFKDVLSVKAQTSSSYLEIKQQHRFGIEFAG